MSIFVHKKKENYWIYGIGAGILEVIYCFFIATLFMTTNNLFIQPSVFIFLLFLLIMVFSVAVSGLLIFGYPLFLAFKKEYQQAIFTVLLSIATLIIVGLIIIIFRMVL